MVIIKEASDKYIEFEEYESVLTEQIKKFGTGSHIILPKEFIGREARIIVLTDNSRQLFIKELLSKNKKLKELPEKYFNLLVDAMILPQFITLDWGNVKNYLKKPKISYDYIDYNKSPSKLFIDKLRIKYKNSKLIIVFLINNQVANLNDLTNYNKTILKFKKNSSFTYGSIINKIKRSKILMIGLSK